MARNVKPILTGSVGDFSSELKENGMAYVVDPDADSLCRFEIDKAYDGRSYVAQARSKYAETYTGLLKHVPNR